MSSLLAISLSSIILAGAPSDKAPVVRCPGDLPADRIVLPSDPLPEAPFVRARRLPRPRRDDIIGELFEAGDTYCDYQTNGSVGKMIAVDPDGGVHVTWMDADDSELDTRHQKYNYMGENGQWINEEGVNVDPGTKSGYGCLWLSEEDLPRALSFCHVEGILEDITGVCGIDWSAGAGAFGLAPLPRYPERPIIWPQGVMTAEWKIHVVCNRRDARMISYTRGLLDDHGDLQFEDEVPVEVSETHLNTYRIARSPNSERAAITWLNSRVGIPAPPEWDGFLVYQMNNDIWLAWTDDGERWNFDEPLNVTDCIPPNPWAEGDAIYGDTLLPYCTHDIIFDAGDNIHIVFETRGLWWNPLDDELPPVDGLTVDASHLWHWSEETGEIDPVADGWFSQRDIVGNDTLWPAPGAWKSNVCNPSLAYDENDDLYCVYNFYPHGDYVEDIGERGRCNGDIAVTVSEDNGESWYYPTMIVRSPSPNAESGEAMCECYPTVAERIDENLHVFYEVDTEPGTSIQDAGATNTLCPFYYQRVPVDSIARDSLWSDGPSFHGERVAVPLEEAWTPSGFRLTGVYPNPFNSRAVVEFELKTSLEVRLEAYTLDGKQAAELFAGKTLSGRHRVTWDASGLPAGIYLIRLADGSAQATRKVVLVK